MDAVAFKVALEAARSFEAEAGGAKFRLRMPTEHAWRLAFEGHRDTNGNLLQAKAMREVLDTAITGWDGVTQGHLLPEGGDAALPFSPDARTLLLDGRQDIADALAEELANRLTARRKDREAAAKN
jgi:hypothetical protein